MIEENEQIQVRKKKLTALKERGVRTYANDFFPLHTAAELHQRFAAATTEELEKREETFSLAGRIMSLRYFGKAAFFHLQDRSGQIQVYVRQGDSPPEAVTLLKESLDVGDLVGVTGPVFRTRTGELTIKATTLRLLSKALRPLPEKWHGLQDVEVRYRQRYLDLIVNPQVRDTFRKRAKLTQLIRQFFIERDFLEVETPIMQSLAGGALAKPFITHHRTLDIDLYLRIAPELFLKRLIVSGVDRVFELGRNFRNEGISTKHNPEYTMLEFYQAYATYEHMMMLTEELLVFLAQELQGGSRLTYGEHEIDLTPPWRRLGMVEAVCEYAGLSAEEIEREDVVRAKARELGVLPYAAAPLGKVIEELFGAVVEPHLIQPTFVVSYPVEVSPLARRNDADPRFVDRFELYIAGRELANAFSELNDPEDQLQRFLEQLREREAGDEEAHALDEDYIRALEYGMPPTAGEGIGIDRLVMLFTNSPSIRDVILFPQMRPEKK
ncbi:MAG: lysine--tRNA ligase [Deltaproteobacteria bacterium]|nr:lysine--tRNA ligase [Deltaproteobacteria bacterium]